MCWGKDRLGVIPQPSLTTALSQLHHNKLSCHFQTAFLWQLNFPGPLFAWCDFTEQTSLSLIHEIIQNPDNDYTVQHYTDFPCVHFGDASIPCYARALAQYFYIMWKWEAAEIWNFKRVSCLQLMLCTQVLWWEAQPAFLDVDMNWAWTPNLWKFPMLFSRKSPIFFAAFSLTSALWVWNCSVFGLTLTFTWVPLHS